jgi:vitamin B12 transporter
MVYNGKKNLNLEAGIRVNNHSRFGNNFTYTLNPSYVLNKQFKFSLNISSAFKAPTLYQLYDGYAGEKSLKPETSVTSEFSIQFLGIKNTSARVVYFNRKINNGIDYSYSTYKYFNYAAQKDNGIEVETGYSNSKINLSLNYTYIKGTVNTANYEFDANTYSYTIKGDTSFPNLFRIPKHSINGSMGLQVNKNIYVSLAQRIAGKRFEPQFQAPSIALKAFQTTDFFFQYILGKKASIYFSLKNILNARYQEVFGFNTRGRNYVIGLRI